MIRPKQQSSQLVIDLTGPEGNAFVLMGYARDFAKQLGWSDEESDALQARMMSGDYENLVQEFDEAFGQFVILER